MGINKVIYMELHSGPKVANGTCGKTIVAGTIDRGSSVYVFMLNWTLHLCENYMGNICSCGLVFVQLPSFRHGNIFTHHPTESYS